MIKRLLLTLSLLTSGAHAAVDLTAKPASGSFTFNSSWTGANGAVEPTTYYHIDEGSGTTLNDLGAENADGTITGADWVTDGSAAALDFVSANSDYVTNLAAWGIANTSSDWTAAVLISIDSGASSDVYFSLGDTTLAANNAGQEIVYGGIGSSTHVAVNRYHGGTAQVDYGASYTATTWQLMWYRWTASTRTLKVYTDNGTEDAGISLVVTSGQQVPDAADGRLGAQATSGLDNPSDARIAGVYIWKSTALTAAQMQDVCNWNGSNCEPWPFLTPSGSCPATCAGGRSARCITDISHASDPNNILYGQSPAVTANEDTVCYDAASALGDTVNVTTDGYPSFASAGKTATDSFDYCIMDNGAACGTDGKYEVSFQPVISSVTGIGTGQTTADITVTPSGPTEGTVQSVAISKTSYDTYGAPTHAQIAAGVDANDANVAWGSEFTKSFLSTVSPGWTFGRASSQTYTKSDGTLGTVTSGNPAFTYSGGTAQGVLLEGQRSALNGYGSNPRSWNRISTKTNYTTTELGVFALGSREASAGQLFHRVYADINLTAGTAYAITFYYMAGTSGKAWITMEYGASISSYRGTIGSLAQTSHANIPVTNASHTDMGGGVWRTQFIATPTATGSHRIAISPDSTTVGEDIIFLGAQIEAGAFPSSFILNTTSGTATRVATSLTRSWNTQTNVFSGYIIARPAVASTYTATAQPLMTLYKDANNYLTIVKPTTAGRMDMNLAIGGTTATAQVTGLTWAERDKLDIRFRKNASGIKLWVEGSAVETTTGIAPNAFTTPPDSIKLGVDQASASGDWIIENAQFWNSVDDTALGALNP